jgi:hypothetical protein
MVLALHLDSNIKIRRLAVKRLTLILAPLCVAAVLLLASADRAQAQYLAPAVPYYTPTPVVSYYTPTVTYTSAYYTPSVAYYAAPAVSYYAAPAVSYYATPSVSYYAAPAVSYYATPAVSYYPAPAVSYYAVPAVSYYAPAGTAVTTTKYGLFGRPRYSTTYYYQPVLIRP